MKSIKQQYIDLNENKMSKAQFMRNARMTLPHLISSTNNFTDAVKILTNKGILLEVKAKKQVTIEPQYQYHPHELELGIEDEGGADEQDMFDKLKEKVVKNLEKDANYYTHKKGGIKKRTKAKEDQFKYREIKKKYISDNQMEKSKEKIVETKLRKLVRKAILLELSSDSFKSYARKSTARGETKRVGKGSQNFFHQFMGKSLLGGEITNISYIEEIKEVGVEITANHSDMYINYSVEDDNWGMDKPVDRKDARILSLIAKKINPNTKYGSGSKGFKIKGY